VALASLGHPIEAKHNDRKFDAFANCCFRSLVNNQQSLGDMTSDGVDDDFLFVLEVFSAISMTF
jgi:hypothetical protein